jgi:hypothetical protein
VSKQIRKHSLSPQTQVRLSCNFLPKLAHTSRRLWPDGPVTSCRGELYALELTSTATPCQLSTNRTSALEPAEAAAAVGLDACAVVERSSPTEKAAGSEVHGKVWYSTARTTNGARTW